MKSLLTGAAAVALGSLATAGTETSSDWLGLDQELNALASNVNTQGGGPKIGALLRTSLISASGGDFGLPANADTLGFIVDDAKIWMQGQVGDYSWRVSTDWGGPRSSIYIGNLNANFIDQSSNSLALEDAYASMALGKNFSLTMGQFKFPTTLSTSGGNGGLILMNRSTLGEFFYNWDRGVMLSGDYDGQIGWWIAAQNGVDGTTDELLLSARAEYRMGAGAAKHQGSMGANPEMNATIGITYVDDGGVAPTTLDTTALIIDLAGTIGEFSFAGEYASLDSGWVNGNLGGFSGTGGGFANDTGLTFTPGTADASPLSLTVGYMLTPDEWELAGRWESLDDLNDTTILSVGVNWYQTGHNAKWQLQFGSVSSDSTSAPFDGSYIALGLTVGSEG